MGVLVTSRLELCPCRIDDLEALHRLCVEPEVCRFLFDGRQIVLADVRVFIDASTANFERHGYGLWLVFEKQRAAPVGFAGLVQSADAAPNLIYALHPTVWGRGYATEAAMAVLRHAFERVQLPRIAADVDEPNIASVRVLNRLGMQRVRRAIVNDRPLLFFTLERAASQTAAGRLEAMSEDFYCEQALSGRTPIVVVDETDDVLAFHHTRPYWPVHIVVVPKQHVPSLVDLGGADEGLLHRVLTVVRRVAENVLRQHGACRVLTNLGGYQDSKHLHFHINSGEPLRE